MKPPLRSLHYQWESLLYQDEQLLEPKPFENWSFGLTVIRREEGEAVEVRCSVYYPNCPGELYLVGAWNDWGKKKSKDDQFSGEEQWWTRTNGILRHKDPYLILLVQNGKETFLRDPAAAYFDNDGNCVFWDFDDPKTYQPKHDAPDTLHRPTIVLQTDPVGLVARWYEIEPKCKTLAESGKDLFTYMRTCGVLEKIKQLGFNTLQFLPVAQSIDGDNWKFRYLVAYPFAIHKNWGSPESFLRLVDECHRLGIAVIGDLIVSHCPHRDFSLFGLDGEDVGLHRWVESDGQEVFLREHTPWGTMRFNYGNEVVRRYLVESALQFIERYRLDGFRIDNVDGILRYGDNGDGPERPHGRQFLRELHSAIYEHKPLTLIHLESHYFYGDNARMLVAPLSSDPRALGATAYNSSRLTYHFHKEFMPKAVEEVSVWRFEHIREEKEWGRSNSTIADFHNHDAAAGLMHGRATGSYAYDALILKRPELHEHAVGKIMVMEAIIAFGCEGRILDLLQTFLLQQGTFEHDSSIHWNLLDEPQSDRVVTYKQRVNSILAEHPCCWPENALYRSFVNVDEQGKVLVMKREDRTRGTKEQLWVAVNLSDKGFSGYEIGIEKPYDGDVLLDNHGDKSILKAERTERFEHYPFCWRIDLRPYHVMVIRRG